MRKRCGQADRIWVSSRRLKGRMDALVAVAPSSPLRQCWLVERYGLPLLSPLTLEFEIRKAHYHFCLLLFLLLGFSFRFGTRLASTAKSASAYWTRCWPVTGPIVTSTVSSATPRNSGLKDTDSALVALS